MPSIIPGYVYTLFAALVVGAIIVSACSLATVNVKNEAVNQQLTNIDQYVATQALNLLTQAMQGQDYQNATQTLNLPSCVGNQIYWVSISNSISGAIVSSGLGSTAILNQQGVSIPAEVNASGVYVSGYGTPMLQCGVVHQTLRLTLSSDY